KFGGNRLSRDGLTEMGKLANLSGFELELADPPYQISIPPKNYRPPSAPIIRIFNWQWITLQLLVTSKNPHLGVFEALE
ncbi:MAG: hypothetical protein M0P11_09720, partial [Anaerolineaceae bacterium]|nr:hypothetical protein [Anaerolineaceae bacterium]